MKRTILSSIGPSLAITLGTIFVGGCLAESEEELAINEKDQSGQAIAALVGEDSAKVGALPTKSTSGVGPGETIPNCAWTQWYDQDDASGWGDYELRADLNPIVCAKPSLVECKTLPGVDSSQTGEIVTCDRQQGFYCKNILQSDGLCQDYKVRFCCPGPSTL